MPNHFGDRASTTAEIVAQLTPVQRIALTLWGEARGSSQRLREAIASVIGNRASARKKTWGKTPDEVCLRPGQFSCWLPAGGVQNHEAVLGAALRLIQGKHAPPILASCLDIAEQVVVGSLPDIVRGATHYYSPAAMVPSGRIPAWANGLTPVAKIDGTLFFIGVA